MIDPVTFLREWKSRRTALDAQLEQITAPRVASPDEIAVLEAPIVGPNRLHPDLLPEGVWGSNLRGILPRRDWDALRIPVCETASNQCTVCGATGFDPRTRRPRRPDCHELWSFEIHGNRFVQRLAGLVAMCADCHRCMHVDLAEIELVRDQLARVNGWSCTQVQTALDHAHGAYQGRLGFAWDLDLTILHGEIHIPGFPGLLVPAGSREALGNAFRQR